MGAHWGEQSLSACPGSLLLSQPGAKNSKVPLGVAIGRLGSHGNVEGGGRGTAEGELPWALEDLGLASAELHNLGRSHLSISICIIKGLAQIPASQTHCVVESFGRALKTTLNWISSSEMLLI